MGGFESAFLLSLVLMVLHNQEQDDIVFGISSVAWAICAIIRLGIYFIK